MRRVCRHLTAVGIRIAQHIPGKLYRHHLHAQTDAKGRNIVRPGVLCGYQFSLNAPLTETGTDDDACHSLQLRGYIVRSHSFAVDEMQSHFHIIIYTCQVQALPNTLIRILQVVFTHQSDVHLTGGTVLLVEEVMPRFHSRSLTHRNTNLPHDGSIKSLSLHTDRHLIDAGHILALHHTFQIDITERGYLHAQRVIQMALGAQHQNVGLDTHSLQFLHGMLRRLGLQLIGSLQIGHVGEMHTHRITSQLPAQLSDGLHKRGTLNVADSTAHLRDDEVKIFTFPQHPPLDFIGDVRHHLNRLTQIVATALAVYHRLIDTPCGDGVVAGSLNTRKPFIMPQVQVGLHPIHRDVAFPMFVRVQCPRVDIDIRVEFLNRHLIAACLEQFADTGGDDSLSEG